MTKGNKLGNPANTHCADSALHSWCEIRLCLSSVYRQGHFLIRGSCFREGFLFTQAISQISLVNAINYVTIC